MKKKVQGFWVAGFWAWGCRGSGFTRFRVSRVAGFWLSRCKPDAKKRFLGYNRPGGKRVSGLRASEFRGVAFLGCGLLGLAPGFRALGIFRGSGFST